MAISVVSASVSFLLRPTTSAVTMEATPVTPMAAPVASCPCMATYPPIPASETAMIAAKYCPRLSGRGNPGCTSCRRRGSRIPGLDDASPHLRPASRSALRGLGGHDRSPPIRQETEADHGVSPRIAGGSVFVRTGAAVRRASAFGVSYRLPTQPASDTSGTTVSTADHRSRPMVSQSERRASSIDECCIRVTRGRRRCG